MFKRNIMVSVKIFLDAPGPDLILKKLICITKHGNNSAIKYPKSFVAPGRALKQGPMMGPAFIQA